MINCFNVYIVLVILIREELFTNLLISMWGCKELFTNLNWRHDNTNEPGKKKYFSSGDSHLKLGFLPSLEIKRKWLYVICIREHKTALYNINLMEMVLKRLSFLKVVAWGTTKIGYKWFIKVQICVIQHPSNINGQFFHWGVPLVSDSKSISILCYREIFLFEDNCGYSHMHTHKKSKMALLLNTGLSRCTCKWNVDFLLKLVE